MEKPSDLISKKEHKLTRRRVIEALTAAGVAPAAASRIGVDDVKASDSDQMPISVDVHGELVDHVPADWYDRIVHTRDVRKKIENGHENRESIFGIGYSAGSKGGENPYIIIHFNENSNSKRKDKEETPDEKEGVEIVKEEVSPARPVNCPDSGRYDHVCDDFDCEPFSEGDYIPAGPIADITYVGGGAASHTSKMMDTDATYHNCWMITAHQVPCCDVDQENVYHQPVNDGGDGYKMGEVREIHPDYDVAVVYPDRGSEGILPEEYVHDSRDLHTGDRYGPIEHTMSKDGVDKWEREERLVFRFGAGTCYNNGEVEATFPNYSVPQGNCRENEDGFCTDELKEIIRISSGSDDGDSGSLQWVYWDEEDAYLGMGITSGGEPDGLIFDGHTTASAGYRIYNDLGYYWK